MERKEILKTHRDSEIAQQLVEETIRESRQLWDPTPLMLDKIKRIVSLIERNLCGHCWQQPTDNCDICNGHYKTE